MHPRLTRQIARWAAGAALAIAILAGAIFARRQRLAARAMRQTPAAVPASVQQRSLKFTFSKMDGQQTVFTIHAAQATRYSGGSGSVLEDVGVVVNGEHGDRHDEIRTRSCQYEAESGAIVCHGAVELDLSSVPLNGPPHGPPASPTAEIHVETRGVTFHRDTGTAATAAPVKFHFPEGDGSAEGADYSSRGADFILRRDVKIRLSPGGSGGAPTLVTAQGGLTFDRRNNQLRLAGPVEIRQGDRQIDTADLTVDLNQQLRPMRAIAEGGTLVRITGTPESGALQADGAEILFDRRGIAEQLSASGHVVVIQQGPAGMRIEAQHAAITVDPASEQPRTIDLSGDVQFQQKRAAGMARLNTDSLYMDLAPVTTGSKKVRLVEATTPNQASTEWNASGQDLRLTSGRLAVTFGADNQIQVLRGSEGVRLERREAGQKPLITTAKDLVATFSDGRWMRTEESGDFRATQGARSAQADRASWLRAEDRLELAGQARVEEPSGQILADAIDWNQNSQELRAVGHVRSTYAGGAGEQDGVAPGAGPVNIVAAAFDANSKTGEAVYSGSARLWLDDLVLEADRIELQRAQRALIATGNVLAALPQAQLRAGPPRTEKKAVGAAIPAKVIKGGTQDPSVLWRIQAGRLIYAQTDGEETTIPGHAGAGSAEDAAGRVTLDGGVEARSSQGRIQAGTLVLQLARQANGQAEIAKADGSGGVTLRQGARWGEAENASYDAGTGKFVLWGGHPSLNDAAGDLVTGHQLTFSLADDTILVESSEGSRTLTRHPVPN